MFLRIARNFATIASQTWNKKPANFRRFWCGATVVGLGTLSIIPIYWSQTNKESVPETSEVTQQLFKGPQIHRNIWQKFVFILCHITRFFHLLYIFLPSMLLYPLKSFKATEEFWIRMFVSAVERAGVVWIKVFQYLSHRRDVIGPEMAKGFMHLRQQAPTHSIEETKEIFRKAYGTSEMFEDFESIPIASASVGQVHKAKYKGRVVVVKTRHPNVQKYIERDVNLMFAVCKFFSCFSKSFEIPVGEESLKKTLLDQIDFNVEKRNLIKFNENFKGHPQIFFPKVEEEPTREAVLVENFVEGETITHFVEHKHALNQVAARAGTSTFFEMFMKHNFIHADCHGGNIIVSMNTTVPTLYGEIKAYLKEKYDVFCSKIEEEFMESDILKRLNKMSREEAQKISQIMRKSKQVLKITLIDAGMTLTLNEEDRMNFIRFIEAIIQSYSKNCAQMIYSLSNCGGKKILIGEHEKYMEELSELFSVLDKKTIFEMDGMDLLIGMMDIIRNNHMKLDGEFATLITNIVVLEAIAKQLDPNIQILKCAVPYLHQLKRSDQATVCKNSFVD